MGVDMNLSQDYSTMEIIANGIDGKALIWHLAAAILNGEVVAKCHNGRELVWTGDPKNVTGEAIDFLETKGLVKRSGEWVMDCEGEAS